MDLLNELTKEDLIDLNEEQKQLLEVVGLEVFKKLIHEYSGRSLYIPQKQKLEVAFRNKKIIQEFDGSNYKKLARKYNITETWVRKIIKDSYESTKKGKT